MYRSSYRSRPLASSSSPKAHKRAALDCNFAIVAILAISTTALTGYVIHTIFRSQIIKATSRSSSFTPASVRYEDDQSSPLRGDQRLKLESRELFKQEDELEDLDQAFSQMPGTKNRSSTGPLAPDWAMSEASEAVETKIKPQHASMANFKQRLASLSKKDLLRLLKILQERIDKAAILVKKRNISPQATVTTATNGEEVKRSNESDQTSGPIVVKDEGVVMRSEKMDRLMGYLDKIESTAPVLDSRSLDKISALSNLNTNNDKQSPIKIVKPAVMNAILRPTRIEPIPLEPAFRSVVSWREQVESVAPDAGWGQQQQQPEPEDWPAAPSSTVRPKKRKKKKKATTQNPTPYNPPATYESTTTSTTTTTTPPPTPPAPEPPSSTAPPQPPAPQPASEEVWIEEEEDIYRPPPRKKTKKYKKKTIPVTEAPSATTSTSTTTSTTTTTQAPTTTTQRASPATSAPDTEAEDWPNDPWPQQQSTQAPSWPESQPAPEEKWPEEEWLNAVKNHVQDQLNIIYV